MHGEAACKIPAAASRAEMIAAATHRLRLRAVALGLTWNIKSPLRLVKLIPARDGIQEACVIELLVLHVT